MPKQSVPTQPGLGHVVVAGGTPAEWLEMSVEKWDERLRAVARAAAAEGAHWVTVVPHHGPDFSENDLLAYAQLMTSVNKVAEVSVPHGSRFVWERDESLHVIVDPVASGHTRFAATVEGLRSAGVDPESLDEEMLSQAVLAPATEEPDLVVVLGPADRIPESMVWELAYSDLVFIDLEWGKFESSHLELAIDDFNRRHRRFGGLDS
jgi:undecaprenyl diphosphate synthase